MNYIKGKVRQLIYESDSGYKVGIFRIKETNDEDMMDFLNKTITFVGYFAELNMEDYYILEGTLIYNEKYGYQYKVSNYEREELKGRDALIEFLSSPLVKGCGEATAKKIVDTLGEDALKLIKENMNNLLLVKGLSEKKALSIYNSVVKYQSSDDMIVELKSYGFTINEALSIINTYGNSSIDVFKNNPYVLKEIIDFKKIDSAYIKLDNYDKKTRELACFLQTIKYAEFDTGNTYFSEEEIYDALKSYFKIILDYDTFQEYLIDLINQKELIKTNNKIFLRKTYLEEEYIADRLLRINNMPTKEIKLFDTEIIKLQESIGVTYNDEQLRAIKSALESRISIISGGPGTGKTTIVKAITKLYAKLNSLNQFGIGESIALLAPTGRASKKLADSTGLGASTIHRYLKWNKEQNNFQVDEFSPNRHKLIIVDETSMIDNNLFASLLKGLTLDIQLVLVGDINQLPSVGAGLVLQDLINSDAFNYTPLKLIYRQSSNSYIPILANEIKNNDISDDFLNKKDDYNFLVTDNHDIKNTLKKICEISINKGLNEKDIQVLAPMYKGENGIDNINIILQDLFNPKSDEKKEIKIGDVIYRENDKVLQLVNDPDNNVFNGDIGYIERIFNIKHPKKEDIFVINYDGIKVEYKREDMFNVRHAYAISIHKSQGSEFPHVIIPITRSYYKMLYNKLIYTGVSRAKKSLILIGEPNSFIASIRNNYAMDRNTDLLNKILHKL